MTPNNNTTTITMMSTTQNTVDEIMALERE